MPLKRGWQAVRVAMAGLCIGLAPTALATPSVVATTGMIGDMVDTIGGSCVNTRVLMGPGIDPHLYRAAASDVRAFQEAALVAYNGFGLEGQLDSVLTRFGERRPTLAVAEAARREGPRGVIRSAGSDAVDPHIWMDARLWAQGIAPTTEALAAVAPECASGMRERASTLREQLHALDGWIVAHINSIPSSQRILLTAHDAFRYFGEAYDIEVRGIQGISTSAEASVADIQSVAGLIAERDIPALFVETTINPRPVDAVVAAARERGADVSIGGSIYGDALGESGTLGDRHIGMLIHNTAEITRALGGSVNPLPASLTQWQAELDMMREGDQ